MFEDAAVATDLPNGNRATAHCCQVQVSELAKTRPLRAGRVRYDRATALIPARIPRQVVAIDASQSAINGVRTHIQGGDWLHGAGG